MADNIGGTGTTFEPVCVQVRKDGYAEEHVPNTGRFSKSNTLMMEVSYVEKKQRRLDRMEDIDLISEDGNTDQRQLRTCTTLDRAQCCTQNIINGRLGLYCEQ